MSSIMRGAVREYARVVESELERSPIRELNTAIKMGVFSLKEVLIIIRDGNRLFAAGSGLVHCPNCGYVDHQDSAAGLPCPNCGERLEE